MESEKTSKLIRIILIILTIAIVGMCACYCCFLFLSNDKTCDIGEISIFLAFLTFAFAISIATPFFISSQKIQDTVKDYLQKEYRTDLLHRAEEVTRTDAHLSRMIAFFLLENKYYDWAIGWSFRAIKRYSGLEGSYTKTYEQFHAFIFREIILKALQKPKNEKDASETRFEDEDESFKIKLRAVKDWIDFNYEINKINENTDFSIGIKKSFKDDLEKIDNGMRSIYQLCLNYVKEEKKFDNPKSEEYLAEKILSQSKYKNREKEFMKFYNDIVYLGEKK